MATRPSSRPTPTRDIKSHGDPPAAGACTEPEEVPSSCPASIPLQHQPTWSSLVDHYLRLLLSSLKFFWHWGEVIVLLKPELSFSGLAEWGASRGPCGPRLFTFKSLSRMSTNPSSSSEALSTGVKKESWATGLSSSTSIFRSGVRHCPNDNKHRIFRRGGSAIPPEEKPLVPTGRGREARPLFLSLTVSLKKSFNFYLF